MAIKSKQFDGLFICEDGSYGGGAILIFDHNAFTDEQIEVLSILGDNDRYDYALALANGEDVSGWEEVLD